MLISAQKNKSRHILFFFFLKGGKGKQKHHLTDIVYDSKVEGERWNAGMGKLYW